MTQPPPQELGVTKVQGPVPPRSVSERSERRREERSGEASQGFDPDRRARAIHGHNDPRNHLPLIEPVGTRSSNEWVQVVFWICPACLTIRADQRCD